MVINNNRNGAIPHSGPYLDMDKAGNSWNSLFLGFLLRIFRKYPGEYEPPSVDILTAAIAYLSIIFFVFTKDKYLQLGVLIAIPFIILIPHFVYIIRNKDINPPGLRKILTVIGKKYSWYLTKGSSCSKVYNY